MGVRAAFLASIVSFALILASSGVTARDDPSPKRQPFLPLARVDIRVPASKTRDLVQVITTFSNTHNLLLERGDFPKSGRNVVNMKVGIAKESFFVINNFKDADVFLLVAYSHEAANIWQGKWTDLVSKLAMEIGEPISVQK
jgi:hypothetical protein